MEQSAQSAGFDSQPESLLELVLAATLEGVVDHDLIAGQSHYSHRFLLMLGFDAEQELARSPALWKELTHADDLSEVDSLWNDHVHNGWPFQHTFRMKHFHGGYPFVLCPSVFRNSRH